MDCRTPLAAVVCLVAGVSGCFPSSWLSRPAAPTTVEPEVKESDKKIKPKTLTAFAALKEQQASDPNLAPDQQDQLREQARRAYQGALSIDPKCLDAHVGLARLFDKMDNREQALARYTQALKLSPKDPNLCHEVGMFHARRKEWAPALDYLRRAAELDPENRQIVKSYGLSLARNGRVEESLAQFRKVMPEAEAHCNVARMLRHMNQLDESKQQVQLALRANPTFEPAHRLMAELEGRTMTQQFVPTGHVELEK